MVKFMKSEENMKVQNKIMQHFNGKKIANQLKKTNLPNGEREKLLIELEKNGTGFESILHHGDVEFDTARSDKNIDIDENIRNFDSLYDVHISKDDILPTGAIIVGCRKVTIDNSKKNAPRANALIAYTHKKGAPFSECLSTSVNYYTQNKCTLTECLGAKVVRYSEINAENFVDVYADEYEIAYTRFANAYYRATRMLEIVELHKNEKLTHNEKMQLKSIYDSARIMYNRSLYDLIDAYDDIGHSQREKIKHSIARDSKKLDLKLHLMKWKKEVLSIDATKIVDYIDKDSFDKSLKRELSL